MNRHRLMPHAYKSEILHDTIVTYCDATACNTPMADHPILAVLPQLTKPDLIAIENGNHPLWVSTKDLGKLLDSIYLNHAQPLQDHFRDLVAGSTFNAETRELVWDEVIARRRFSSEQIESQQGVPVIDDTSPNSPHLNDVDRFDMNNIQKYQSYLWTVLGNPIAIHIYSAERSRVGYKYVATYAYNAEMSKTLDMLLNAGPNLISPVVALGELVEDNLRSLVPTFDTLRISPCRDNFGFTITLDFENAAIPSLMINLHRNVFGKL